MFHNKRFLKFNWEKILIVYSLYIFIIVLSFDLPLISRAFSFQTIKQQTINQKREYQKWRKLLKSFPVDKNALKLQHQFSFPKTELENKDIFLYLPSYLCSDSKGNIFVSDMGNHNIIKFDSKGNYLNKIGKIGQAPGEFFMPRYIETDSQNNLIVYDTGNSRIQIFNPKGEYLNSFKIFKTYIAMVIDKHGLIYLNPLTSNLQEPLIEILNKKGKLINSFGKRIKFKHNSDAHNEIAMSINNKGEIFAAWKHFPIVRRYSKEGKLLSEYKINYKLIKRLAKPNYKAKIINHKMSMMSVITDIRAKENKFYLFIRYPRIEVLELSLKGEIVKIYWKDHPYKYIARDFLVKENANKKLELLYVLNTSENQIKVFSANKFN